MTNKQYHRRLRALARLDRKGVRPLEAARLRVVVGEYQRGGLRAKNGRGTGLHSSGPAA